MIALICVSCKEDKNEAPIPKPQITNLELGIDNSATILKGNDLLVKAEISAEGSIDRISIEIRSESSTVWSFDSVYSAFSGQLSVSFESLIAIPLNADTGLYALKITVFDLEGDSDEATGNFQIQALDIPSFDNVNGFAITSSGVKYLATNLGLYIFDEDNDTYNLVEDGVQIVPVNSIALSKLSSVEELWLGSDEGALNLNTQTQYQTTNSGLHNNDVSHFSFDVNDRVFFGTTEGVSIKDANEWIMRNIGKDSIYVKHSISSMGTATNGYTYVATSGGGVERFKYDVDGVSGATIFDEDWTQLKTNFVNTVYIYDTIQVYGTPEGAAIHYSHLTKWDWDTYTVADGLIHDNVISIVKDHNDNLWFGTIEGLSMYDGTNWTSYTEEADGIISNNIKYLEVDSDGSVWIACDDGLSKFSNNQWVNFPK